MLPRRFTCAGARIVPRADFAMNSLETQMEKICWVAKNAFIGLPLYEGAHRPDLVSRFRPVGNRTTGMIEGPRGQEHVVRKRKVQ